MGSVSNIESKAAFGNEADRANCLLENLVGARSGIIRRVNLIEPGSDEAPLFHVGAQVANAHPHWGDHLGLSVGGCGLTEQRGLISALCEGFERYAGSSYRPSIKPQAADALHHSYLPADHFVQFSNQQRAQAGFPYVRPNGKTPMRWVTGKKLSTPLSDAPACDAPAFAVYVLYEPAGSEPPIGPGLSTGLACGDSLEQALVHATCEVIERDAVALHWMTGTSPPRVNDALVAQCAGDVLPPQDHVRAYDLTTDLGLPVMMVLCTGLGVTGSLLSVGSACHRDPHQALRKAAMEAGQTRKYIELEIQARPDFKPAPDFSNVSDFSRHARLYCGRPKLARKAIKFLEGTQNSKGNLKNNSQSDNRRGCPGFDQYKPDIAGAFGIDQLANLFEARDIEAAWFDLTPPWAEPLNLYAVRVLIPDLMPLHGHHGFAQLSHRRLANFKAALPYGVRYYKHKIWPYPHPFP